MASAELSRRIERVVGYPPLSKLSDLQRREFHEALLDADSFEDLPGRWQAAMLTAEQNRPKLRLITGRVKRRSRQKTVFCTIPLHRWPWLPAGQTARGRNPNPPA